MNKLNQLWKDLRGSLWFVPGVMIVVSIALALVLVEVDSRADEGWLEAYPLAFGLGADGARGMLTAIASSMLTVAALVFSLTLNAVSQASGQFTPRIFRNFMRDRANQFVLGYFVSVFAYCLLVLRTIRGADELKFVPSLAVITGLLLAIGGILVLIFFIHHIAASLQITTILDNIREETTDAIEKLFSDELGNVEAASGEASTAQKHMDATPWWGTTRSDECGYVQDVDVDGLLELASEEDLLIETCVGAGDYVGRGASIARFATASTRSGADVNGEAICDRINRLFSIGRYRTIEHDVGYGIRQIVDIALKALSPGVNDTTTAINCIDSLGEIVGEIARRRLPERVRSRDNIPRVSVATIGFSAYVETAFDQIWIAGKSNHAVFERLLSTLMYIGECTAVHGRRDVLETQVELISEYADQTLSTEYEKEKVRERSRDARKLLRAP